MSAPHTLPPRTVQARPVVALVGLLLMLLLGIAQAAAPTITSVQFRVDEHLLRVALQVDGTLPAPTVEALANPPRLVIDYPGTEVLYNEGNPRVFPIHLENVQSLKVLQQSGQPAIARVVVLFETGTDAATLAERLVIPTAGGQIVVSDQPLSAIERENLTAGKAIDAYDAAPIAPAAPSIITRLIHEKFGADHDRFRFESEATLPDPEITLDGPRLVCRFADARFRLPASSAADTFNAPVDGAVVREFQIINEAGGGVLLLLTLDPPAGHTLTHELIRIAGTQLQLDVHFAAMTTPEPAPLPGLPLPPAPALDSDGTGEQIAVLAGGQEATGLTITQIQYQPTTDGERFIIFGNEPFAGSLERLTGPDRQVFTVTQARVALPAGVGDRYTIPLSSDLVQDMQVIVKETPEGPEAQINWRLKTAADRDVAVHMTQVEPTIWHVDFTPAIPTAPIIDPMPTPDPEPAIEPVTESEPVAEPMVEPEPTVEIAVVPEPEPIAEPIVETEPAIEREAEPIADPDHRPMTLPTAPERVEPEPVIEAPAPIEEPVAVEPEPEPVVEPVIEEPIAEPVIELPAAEPVAEPAMEMPVAEPVVEPVIEAPASNWLAPVTMDRSVDGAAEIFTFESTVNITPRIETAKFPNRILVIFERHPVEFGGLEFGKTRFFKSAAASSVRMLTGKTPEQIVVQIAMDRPLDQIDYFIATEGNRATLRVTPIAQPAPEPVIEAPVVMEEPAPIIEVPAPVIEEPAPAIEAPVEATRAFTGTMTQTALETVLAAAMPELGETSYEIAPSAAGAIVSIDLRKANTFQFLQALKDQGIRYKKIGDGYRFYMMEQAVATPVEEPITEPVVIERPAPVIENPVPVEEPAPVIEIAPEPEPAVEVTPEPEPVIEEPVVLEPELTVAEREAEAARIEAAAHPVAEPTVVEPAEDPEAFMVEPEPVVEAATAREHRPEPVVIEEPAHEPTPVREEPVQIAKLDPPATDHIHIAVADAGNGTAITGITHEVVGDADIFNISYNGELGEPMANWLNYPAQLAISFLNTDLRSGDAGRQVASNGERFDAYKLWTGGNDDDPTARISLYLREGTQSDGLNYTFDRVAPGKLTVRVTGYSRPASREAVGGHRELPAMDAPPAPREEGLAGNTGPGLGSQQPNREAVPISDGGTPATGTVVPKRTGRYFGHFDPTKSSEEGVAVANDPLVTLDLRNASAADVITTIAESYNLSISVDRSITQEVTVKVVEKPLTVVFDTIASQVGVKWFLSEAGIYIFAPESKLRSVYGDSFQDVIIWDPKFASATQLQQALRQMRLLESSDVTILKSQKGGASSAGGVANATEKLIIRVTPSRKDLILRILKELDTAPIQIRLDVKIMRVSQQAARRSGIDWIINNGGNEAGAVSFSLQEKTPSTGGFDPITGANIPVRGRRDIDLLSGFERDPANRMSIQAVLNYLETEGEAVTINNPNLVVASGQSATLFVGEKIPFRSTFQVSDFGRVTQRISNQDIGLSLSYSARADMDTGLVSLSVTPDLSSLQGLTDIGPRTSNSNFTTNLVIPSGESFVVGGLLNDTSDSSQNKIPILGDLPLIGKLFRSKRKTIDKSELILIFTPTILDIYANPVRFADHVWSQEAQ